MFPNDSYNSNQTNVTNNFSAKLAILGSVITTFGDALSTIAAIQSLEETLIENAKQEQYQKEQEQKIQSMQTTIDSLTDELAKLKELITNQQ